MEFPRAKLLLFIKAPVPGKVKTRLAGRFGPRGAATLYRTMVRRLLNELAPAGLCPVELWCAPSLRHAFFASCRRDYAVELRVQRGSDLGKRMDHALGDALQRCDYAVVVGGDCVSLGIPDVRGALRALASGKDAVLAPAEDGGYVLVGLRRPCPPLFSGISWGGNRVLWATRLRLARAGLDWAELPTRWDVDRPADVRRMRRNQPGDRRIHQVLSVSPNDSVVYRSISIPSDQ